MLTGIRKKYFIISKFINKAASLILHELLEKELLMRTQQAKITDYEAFVFTWKKSLDHYNIKMYYF